MVNKDLEKKIMFGVCIALTLGILGVLFWLVLRNKDNFCGACQNMGLQVNTDRKLLHDLYNKG